MLTAILITIVAKSQITLGKSYYQLKVLYPTITPNEYYENSTSPIGATCEMKMGIATYYFNKQDEISPLATLMVWNSDYAIELIKFYNSIYTKCGDVCWQGKMNGAYVKIELKHQRGQDVFFFTINK
jgi:hypothetical protein